jgi:hypothetical protein
MQSLKYIVPVVLVLILLSVGMYFFGDQISAAGPEPEETLSETAQKTSEPNADQEQQGYVPQPSPLAEGYYDISWVDLADVEFKPKFYEEVNQNLLFPDWGERPKILADKPIVLPGYILPTDVENGIYVLSAFTMNSCFFCGAAGPESVVQLKMKPDHREYRMDEWVTFKGTLRLNDSDIDQLNYIIEDAEEIPTGK